MSLRRFVPVLFVLGLCAAGLRAQQQFSLLATVLDPAKGTPIETLTAADVHVLEDGAELKVVKVDAIVRTVMQVFIDNGTASGRTELRNGVRGLGERPDVETTVVTTRRRGAHACQAHEESRGALKGVDRRAPDSATGRFTESLTEAAERANKEKDTFTVIITAGTTSGDGHIREVHTKRLVEQISGKPIVVHVLMYAGEKSATGGDSQTEVGRQVAKMTGGRYEYANNLIAYAKLLPEFGSDVAKQVAGSSRQFRITAQRPDGKSGKLGKLGMSTGSGVVTSVRVE